MNKFIPAVLVSGLISAVAFAAPVSYQIDPTHTSVIASWNHFGFSNPTAAINGAEGTIVFDKDAPEDSKIDVSVKIDTIDSFVKKLNEEFVGADWFNAAKFPSATFTSTDVEMTGDKTMEVTGDLTIKGVTKSVTMDVTLNGSGVHPMTQKEAIGFDAMTTIKRSDFGIDMYVPNVSDEVTLHITTEAQAK